MLRLENIQPSSNEYIVDLVSLDEFSMNEVFNDIKILYKTVLTKTSASSVWTKDRPLFARPDILCSSNGLKILELNIDTAIAPQSLVAYLQNWHNVKIEESSVFVSPFVKVLSDIVNSLQKPVAFLGTKEMKDFANVVDEWFVNEINSLSNYPVKFYPCDKWFKKSEVSEPIFIRWFSLYQMNRHKDMKQAYNSLLTHSHDLCPISSFPILDSKSILSELWELKSQSKVNSEEGRVIEKYIPYTLELSERNINIDSDLIKDVINNKSKYVLKKSRSHGARDVYIGNMLSLNEWSKKIYEVFKTGEYIVQEFVENNICKRLRSSNGTYIQEKDFMCLIGIFIINWKVPGVLLKVWDVSSSESGFSKRIAAISKDYQV